MGYTHIFLFFMCINFGLGITTIADTPLAIPSTHERCFIDYTDNSEDPLQTIVVYNNATGVWEASEHSQAIDDIVSDIEGDPTSGMGTTPGSSGAPGPFDPIIDFTDQSYAILNTMKNFIAGGFITDVLAHISLACDMDPESPTFGEPIENEVWNYFVGGIQVIFGFLLCLTLFNWLTGRSTDLGS